MEVAIPPANQPLQVEVVYEPDDDVVESYTVVVKEEVRGEDAGARPRGTAGGP